MFLNKTSNSWGSLFFTRTATDITPKKEEEVNIDLLPSLTEKLNAENQRKTKEEKRAMPGETLLKKLHKEQKKNKNKNTLNNEYSNDNLDIEKQKKNIDKYTNSINHVMKVLEL